MGLSINTNLAAMQSVRRLETADDGLQRSLRRLSSGLRINSAADDAAGLSISMRMEAERRGLSMASRSTQDGVSLLQTAEGGARQIVSMLQRMRELSVEAGNDTLTTSDRSNLQEELNQLSDAVDSIATATTFNGKKLLDVGYQTPAKVNGSALISLNYATQVLATSGTVTGTPVTLGGGATTDFGSLVINGTTVTLGIVNNAGLTTQAAANHLASVINGNAASPVSAAVTGVGGDQLVLTAKTSGTAGNFSINSGSALAGLAGGGGTGTNYDAGKTDFGSVIINGITTTFGLYDNNGNSGASAAQYLADQINATNGTVNAVVKNGKINLTSVTLGSAGHLDITAVNASSNGSAADDSPIGFTAGTHAVGTDPQSNYLSSGLTMQVGAKAGDTLTLTAAGATASALGVTHQDLDVSSSALASSALQAVDGALDQMGSLLSTLGALTNRLGHAIRNDDQSGIQVATAQSRIQDLDFARETTTMARQQILTNSSTAMLSQATQSTSSVMALLLR